MIIDHDDLDVVVYRLRRLAAHAFERKIVRGQTEPLREGDVSRMRRPGRVRVLEALRRVHLLERQNRGWEEDTMDPSAVAGSSRKGRPPGQRSTRGT